jgi:hypothetical protein
MAKRYLPKIDYDSREANLPVWAQEILSNARIRTKQAETEAEEARLATDPASSTALLNMHTPIPVGLGDKPKVCFVLSRRPDGDPLDYIEIRHASHSGGSSGVKWGIELHGSSTLQIQPQVTNVIHVWPREIGGRP